MIDRYISPHMREQAAVLLARSARWSRGTARTTDGRTVNVVTFSSSRQRPDGSTVTYMARSDGACCNCPGFLARQACSHALACKMEAERAREAAARKPRLEDLMDEWIDGRTGTVSAF